MNWTEKAVRCGDRVGSEPHQVNNFKNENDVKIERCACALQAAPPPDDRKPPRDELPAARPTFYQYYAS